MKIQIIAVVLLFSTLLSVTVVAQEQTVYPSDGVYTSFVSFRKGKPEITKDKLVRSLTSTNDFTIRQWVNSENLYFIDKDSSRKMFESKEFWGFVENGTLYLALGYKFHKVSLLGQISYFLESYPVIKGNVAPVVTESRSTAIYRILDMETGDLVEYDISNLEEILMRDEKLYNEFMALETPKAKKKKMYAFMEQYNKAHPLLPLSEL
jgi:hypothetical protein